jgi:hypothetical protein
MIDAGKLIEALQPGPIIYPAFVRLQTTGGKALGLPAAVLLSHAYYMARKRGKGWIYTPADWSERTGLGEDQIKRALRRLCSAKLLARRRVGVIKRMVYTLDLDRLAALLLRAPVGAFSPVPVGANSHLREGANSHLRVIRKEALFHRKSVRPEDQRAEGRAHTHGLCSWDDWNAYARELSPVWAKTRDPRKCWDDMEAAGWIDTQGRPVRSWQAKARRYLETWRDKGGRDREERAAAAASLAVSAAPIDRVDPQEAQRRKTNLEDLARLAKRR